MATTIEWTRGDDGTAGKTWNPVRGCSLVSSGCKNCYAMKQGHRFSGEGMAYQGLTKLGPNGPTWTGKVVCDDAKLLEPLSWRKPARVFVNSMSDLFHEDVPDAFIDKVFAVMALAPRHTFQVLTKRPERMLAYFEADIEPMFERWADAALTIQPLGDGENATEEAASRYEEVQSLDWPLPNVWLGVSVENQEYADERIPLLLQTPAAVRFISAEPLLGPVDVRFGKGWQGLPAPGPPNPPRLKTRTAYIDWVIVGGESGPGARPCRVQWVRDIVAQCRAASVPVFVKQLGARPEGDPRPPERVNPETGARTLTVMQVVEIHDRKGGDPAEWPADLRVRQFPEVVP